jgi:hypothetical protein
MEKKITLKIDGKKVSMNAFVEKIFINIISGMLDSLDKLPEEKDKIELILINEEKG